MNELKTDSLGNPISGEPTIRPRGTIAKQDSLTTEKLVELVAKALLSKKQQHHTSTFQTVETLRFGR